MLPHHPSAEQAHRAQHQWIKTNRRQRQPGVDRQHERQGEAVGKNGVGETQDREAQQPPDVLDITGGAADHLTAAGGLNPGRLLPQHVVEQSLPQLHFHLSSDAEHQLPRKQTHAPHGGGEQHDPARLTQHTVVGKAFLKLIDDATHLHGDGDAEDVDHDQRQSSQKHGAPVGPQIAADQIEAHGGHAVSRAGRQPRQWPIASGWCRRFRL